MPQPQRHIIAIGGAAFRAEPQNLAADRYILQQTGKKRPKVCFIPTASAEPAEIIALFVDLYTVARNAVQVGTESYGLKHLERLAGFVRIEDIPRAGRCIVTFDGPAAAS